MKQILLRILMVILYPTFLLIYSCSTGGGTGEDDAPSPYRFIEMTVYGLDPGESFDLEVENNSNTYSIKVNTKKVQASRLERNSLVKLKIKNPPPGKVCFFKEKPIAERYVYMGINNIKGLVIYCGRPLPKPKIYIDTSIGPLRNYPTNKEIGAIVIDGKNVELVVGEAIISSKNESKVLDIISRWNGTMIKKIDLNSIIEDADNIYIVQIDLTKINISDINKNELATKFQEYSPVATGDIVLSSENVLKMLYFVLTESKDDVLIVFNALLKAAAPSSTNIIENVIGGPSGYSPNVMDWPYMKPGGDLNINVVGAWIALENAGILFDRKINISVFDGGFRSPVAINDLPPGPGITIDMVNEDLENAMGCGVARTDCPWHGTFVAAVLAAQAENRANIAGPASYVVKRLRLIGWGFEDGILSTLRDFFDYVSNILYEISRVGNPFDKLHIVNFSGAWDAPAVIGAAVSKITDPLFSYVRIAGTIPFAAAGNEGTNVDATDCALVVCWEETVWLPCEASGIVCVGGTNWTPGLGEPTQIDVAADSNYGTDGLDAGRVALDLLSDVLGMVLLGLAPGVDTVDIYAPYAYYAPNIAANGLITSPPIRIIQGTSFASPFTAGIAALVLQGFFYNEFFGEFVTRFSGMTDDVVLGAMLASARYVVERPEDYDGPSYQNQPLVNALGAVAQILTANGDDPYSIKVQILRPENGDTFLANHRVLFLGSATTDPLTGERPTLRWTSSIDGPIGEGPSLDLSTLSPGDHIITLTASVSDGRSASKSIRISIINVPPKVEIINPTDSGLITLCRNENAFFEAMVHDPNYGGPFDFPDDRINWLIYTDVSDLLGINGTQNFTFTVTRNSNFSAFAADDYGEIGSDSLYVNVEECIGNPPIVNIIEPLNEQILGTPTGTLLVTLRGSATDPEDGDLSNRIEWYVNGRFIGVGSMIQYTFEESTIPYRIKAVVVDSDGNIRERNIEILVKISVL